MDLRYLLPSASGSLLLVGLAACSSSGSSGSKPTGGGDAGTDAATTAIDKAASDVAAAYCARAQACAPAVLQIGYGDVATCTTTFAADIVRAQGGAGVKATAEQIAACAPAFQAVACKDFVARRTPAACKPIAGTLADGSACAADGQCTGTRCKVAFGQVCGTCASHAAAGAACGVDDDCDTGLACIASVCRAFSDEAGTCDATHPCRPDLACVSGACAAPGAVGATCSAPDQCAGLAGQACNPQSKKCDAMTFGGAHAPCGFVGGHVSSCTGASLCVNLNANFQGTCSAAAAVGAACDTSVGPSCGPGAVCVCAKNVDGGCAGTCQSRDPASCK